VGRQVNFYATTEDERTLRQRAHELGARAVPKLIVATRKPAPISPLEPRPKEEECFYLLPRGVRLKDVSYSLTSDGKFLQLLGAPPNEPYNGMLAPPAVELIHSTCEEPDELPPLLARGRIYLSVDRVNAHYDAAMSLYEALARIVRKWPRSDVSGREYVGPHALESALRGDPIRIPKKIVAAVRGNHTRHRRK
jgi:hypothetical protein